MALVSHSTIGGPQFLTQQTQAQTAKQDAGIVVVGADHIAHQQQLMNGAKPGSSSGSSMSGSDSLSGSSSSTTVPSHLNNARHPYAQAVHYGHHPQATGIVSQMMPNGDVS
jgi:hypothetical protein